MQHRHEVALAGAERAVEERAVAALAVQRSLDERQGLVEVRGQLRRDDVVRQGGVRVGGVLHTLRQLEDVVSGTELLGDGDDVAERGAGHERAFLSAGVRMEQDGPVDRLSRSSSVTSGASRSSANATYDAS